MASDIFSYLLKMTMHLLSHSIYRQLENWTNSFSVCADKIVYQIFFQILSHFGYLVNGGYPDQPASSEAGWSGSILFSSSLCYVQHPR